jgi:hypothetical protein
MSADAGPPTTEQEVAATLPLCLLESSLLQFGECRISQRKAEQSLGQS